MRAARTPGLFALAAVTSFSFAAGHAAAEPGEPAISELSARHAIPAGELSIARRLPSLAGETIRVNQTHRGVPVHGASAAIRKGAFPLRTSTLAPGLSISVTPSLTERDARDAVAHQMAHGVPPASRVLLRVLPTDDSAGRLVYFVHVWRTPFGPSRYLVDAHTGEVFARHRLVHSAQGKVYGVDPEATPTPTVVDLPNLTSTSTLSGRAATVASYRSGSFYQQNIKAAPYAVPNATGDYLFDPVDGNVTDDAFAEVNAYYHIDRIDTFFRTKLKVPMGYGLTVLVNMYEDGQPMDNAFFTPYDFDTTSNLIGIGQGESVDFAVDSDVFLHEFTHYVNHNTVEFNDGQFGDGYGLNSMPGGLDEGLADYFACTVNGDPTLGSTALGDHRRDLAQSPGKCPDNMVGESHFDGKIVGYTAWALRNLLGAEVADDVIWSAVQTLHKGATFAALSRGIVAGLDAAKTKGTISDANHAAAIGILAANGLSDCDRTLTLPMGGSRTSGFMGLTILGYMFGGYSCTQMTSYAKLTSLFQYKLSTTSTDSGVTFDVKFEDKDLFGDRTPPGGETGYSYSIYVRKGRPIAFTGGFGGRSTYKASGFDYKMEGLTQREGYISLGAGGDAAFEPGQDYYVAILHTNCSSGVGTVSANPIVRQRAVDAGPPEAGRDGADVNTPDAGPGHADAAPDGTTQTPDVDASAGHDAELHAESGATKPPRGPDANATSTPSKSDDSGCATAAAPSRTAGGVGVAAIAALAALVLRRGRGRKTAS